MALSVLRVGFDTRTCRFLKETLTGPVAMDDVLQAVAARVEPRPAQMTRLIAAGGARASQALASAERANHQFVGIQDPDYPPLLRHIVDPPVGLWARAAALSVLAMPAVAIVGSRKANPGGLMMARRLGRELAAAGLAVVSGLARGIDEAAHRGALDAGGVTIGVLGSGLDVLYPPEHARLTVDLVRRGALLSELPPGTRPLGRHFPLRNRIISGLSLAVVVVEASERSGSLITARMALEQGRDVLAVPGPVVSGCHRGCHALIKDGARLVESAADVLDQIGWPGALTPGPVATATQVDPLVALMPAGDVVSLDELAARSGRSAPDLLATLGRLELGGRVARSGAGFVRLDGFATNRRKRE